MKILLPIVSGAYKLVQVQWCTTCQLGYESAVSISLYVSLHMHISAERAALTYIQNEDEVENFIMLAEY